MKLPISRFVPFWTIIGFSLLVHLPGITSPLLDYQAYRQCQTASMARNYVRHGMHFLTPELDTEGRPQRAGTEFPIYSYLLAWLFKGFGLHDIWGRLLSAFFGAWGSLFLYGFVRKRLGELRAFWSALVLCALPVHVFFTRAVQPEPMALWGLLGFLYFWDRFLDDGRSENWLGAVVLGATAPLLKLPYLYVLFPVWAYLTWEKEGWRRRCWSSFFGIGTMLGMTWLWYHYAKTAPVGVLPLTPAEHWANLRPIFTFKLWRNHFISRIPELCLTYPGLLLAITGVRQLYREHKLRFWGIWFAATALYIVLLGEYGIIHRYTELPFAPVNAVLIGSGIVALWKAAAASSWKKAAVTILIIGIPIHTGFRIAHWYRWEYPWVLEARRDVALLSQPDDLVITNTREHPVLLYHIERYGYAPALEETGLEILQGYRAKGARLFLTPADEGWARHPEWKPYFDTHARLLKETPHYLIYRLN